MRIGTARVLSTPPGSADRSGSPPVVPVTVGDPGQALVAGLAEPLPGALAALARGRSRAIAMPGIDLGQEADVLGRVAPSNGLRGRSAPVPQRLPVPHSPYQAREPRPRQPGHLGQIRPHQALLSLAKAPVPEALERLPDKGIARLPYGGLNLDPLATRQKGPQVIKGLQPLGL